MGTKKPKSWTAAGTARAARDARINTVRFSRDAPIARAWQESKMLSAFQIKVAHLGNQTDYKSAQGTAASLLLTGLGYPETWQPTNWMEAAERVLGDEASAMADAELYILSPEMCDVVVAAAQTLTLDDVELLTKHDLPSRSGMLYLPYPLLVKAVNGNLGDDRAYRWQTPVQLPKPDPDTGEFERVPAVRIALYHDSHGPVRPDSFLDFAAAARAQGTPLPPLLLDAMRCYPFGMTATDEQRRNLADFVTAAQRAGQHARERNRELGTEEERVIGEYIPGSEIEDPDDSFSIRFLYAFWRLCEQRIAVAEPAEVRHAARVAADKARVSPEVRVVKLRPAPGKSTDERSSDTNRQWRHRWVVRMHKVRQWYPSEQRHKVIYRGPYVKGPDDKPFIGGEVVRGMTH